MLRLGWSYFDGSQFFTIPFSPFVTPIRSPIFEWRHNNNKTPICIHIRKCIFRSWKKNFTLFCVALPMSLLYQHESNWAMNFFDSALSLSLSFSLSMYLTHKHTHAHKHTLPHWNSYTSLSHSLFSPSLSLFFRPSLSLLHMHKHTDLQTHIHTRVPQTFTHLCHYVLLAQTPIFLFLRLSQTFVHILSISLSLSLLLTHSLSRSSNTFSLTLISPIKFFSACVW